jgi:hypothetical protein
VAEVLHLEELRSHCGGNPGRVSTPGPAGRQTPELVLNTLQPLRWESVQTVMEDARHG